MGAGYSMRARGDASAEIFIYEDVGESFFGGVTAKDFAADLKGLGEVETINLRINSPGGDVFDGLAIYRQLVDHRATVVSHVDGIAASIASVIAMAGKEIRISESGFMMIHNASGFAMGDAATLRGLADTLDTVSSTIADVYSARTGISSEEITAMMDAETWFTGADAVAKGLATSIVQNMKVAARSIDASMHKFRHIPAALAARPNYDAAQTRLNAMRAKLQNNKLRTA